MRPDEQLSSEARATRLGSQGAFHQLCGLAAGARTGAAALPTPRRQAKRRGSALPSSAVPFQPAGRAGAVDLVDNNGRQSSDTPLWIVGSSGCLAVRRGTLKAATFISNGGLILTATPAVRRAHHHGLHLSTPASYQDEESRLGRKRERCFGASPCSPLPPFYTTGAVKGELMKKKRRRPLISQPPAS